MFDIKQDGKAINMLKLLFSIPIHERLEAVVDQIINIQSLNEDAGVVLHLSLGYEDKNSDLSLSEFEQLITQYKNVYINPNRVRTGNYDIIQAHIENFNFAKNVVDFEYFCMCASNELFIRPGLYDYISKYDCGLDYNDVDCNVKWKAGRQAQVDESLKLMMSSLDTTKIVGSQVEGTFYRKQLYERVADVIMRYYDYRTMDVAYAREEVYFSTIFWAINRGGKYSVLNKGMFTFCPWQRQFTMNVRLREVININNKVDNNIYSVKRVERRLNDCIRAYVRQKYGYVDREKAIFGAKVNTYSYVAMYCCEIKKELRLHWAVLKKIFRKIRSVSDAKRYIKQYLHI